jgi:hypothetical protein
MYHNNNNSHSHPDPFAGQYPPPPPLQSPPLTEPTSNTAYYPPQPPQETFYQPQIYPQPEVYQPTEVYPMTQQQQDVYSPPPTRTDFYNYHNTSTPLDEERHVSGVNDYQQHLENNTLDEYLRKEREEYLKHEPKQNQVAPYYNTKQDEQLEPEKIPMVQKDEPLSRKERKKLEKLQKQQQGYQPYVTKPTLAPENEAESYKPRPYGEEKKSGCNCCCYNPAITCCSFFCLLISVAFFAAGVAMMIASKVVTDKCNNECANVIDQAQNACGTICSKVLHDGMLYGGAVVAGLAGIAIVWKIIMWTCAGYSKR